MTAQNPAARPRIKILLYTDDPNAITDGKNLLGLGSMIERLQAHAPVFAELTVKWVSRSSDTSHHADNKLDVVMSREVQETGEPFDEIWFFGLHQANTEKFSLGVFRGGPESELSAKEVEELSKWMKAEGGAGGGVLMTGDHNNPVPANWIRNANSGCADPATGVELLGLGRAIGRCVPRAGELRKWEGPPSSNAADSLNTVSSFGFQTDRVPQSLIHQRVNAEGEPDPDGQPHPLFFYQPGNFVDIFPDHRHEGELVIPDLSNTAVWPVGPTGQPKPYIVAYGIDRRTGKKMGLVTAYDGDRAGVGRIVADSSWHHYTNINLKGFPHPAAPKSFSDKIGQFYGNLAIWLAPLHKRRLMAQAMYSELAAYTLLLEQHDDPLHTGEIAYSVLGRSTSSCEMHELLRAFGPARFAWRGSSNAGGQNVAHAEQRALGLILDSYQKAMIRAEGEAMPVGSIEVENIVEQQLTKVRAAAAGSSADDSTNVPNASPNASAAVEAKAESATVTTNEDLKEWTIEINRESQAGQPPFVATLIFNLTVRDGVVTGQVWDGVDRRLLSDVKGTHRPLPGDDHWFMTLDFTWGNVNVTLFGVTIETPQTVLFNGRFKANASPTALSKTPTGALDPNQTDPIPMAPGDGDTGSGTGQQT